MAATATVRMSIVKPKPCLFSQQTTNECRRGLRIRLATSLFSTRNFLFRIRFSEKSGGDGNSFLFYLFFVALRWCHRHHTIDISIFPINLIIPFSENAFIFEYQKYKTNGTIRRAGKKICARKATCRKETLWSDWMCRMCSSVYLCVQKAFLFIFFFLLFLQFAASRSLCSYSITCHSASDVRCDAMLCIYTRFISVIHLRREHCANCCPIDRFKFQATGIRV